MTSSPALMEAAKVLYEAEMAEMAVSVKPEHWRALGDQHKRFYLGMAAALLRWERTREPSEAMIQAAYTAPNVHYDGFHGLYAAMNRQRLLDLGVAND